jgi:hypothetical protein
VQSFRSLKLLCFSSSFQYRCSAKCHCHQISLCCNMPAAPIPWTPPAGPYFRSMATVMPVSAWLLAFSSKPYPMTYNVLCLFQLAHLKSIQLRVSA